MSEYRRVSVDIDSVRASQDILSFLKEQGRELRQEDEHLFAEFFTDNGIRVANMPNYTCIPSVNEVMRNYRLRYLVIKAGEGYYLAVFRIVTPMNRREARDRVVLSCPVLSLLASAEENTIYALLYEKGVEEMSVATQGRGKDLNLYCTEQDYRRLQGKWAHRNRIAKMKSLVHGRPITAADSETLADELEAAWNRHNGTTGSHSHVAMSLCREGRLQGRVWLCGDRVVAYWVYSAWLGCGFSILCKTAVQTELLNDLPNIVRAHLGDLVKYEQMAECFERRGLKALYLFGAREDDERLLRFKERFCSERVAYRRVKLRKIIQ